MVVAIIILSSALAAALGLIGWLVHRHVTTVEAQAVTSAQVAATMRDLADQRDAANTLAAQATADSRSTDATLRGVALELAAAREELSHAVREKLVGATDADVVGVVAGMLKRRRDKLSARTEATSADRGAGESATVPGPRTGADAS